MRRAVLALIAAALPLAYFGGAGGSGAKHHALAQPQHPSAHSEHRPQPWWRRGSIRTSSGRGSGYRKRPATIPRPIRPACTAAERDSGECSGSGGQFVRQRRQRPCDGQERQATARAATRRRPRSTCAPIANELVAEIDGSLSDAQADELARRHGLARLQSQNFPLIGSTIGLFRITDRRAVGDREPRTRRRCQRSLGAAELPLCAAGAEGGLDRRRSRAICGRETSVCPRRTSLPTAPMSPLP